MKQLYKMRGGVIVSIILMLAFFTVGCKTDDDDDGETPSPTSYTITIAEGIEHGSVSASPTTAAAGASVTLTATPADGYELASLTVTNAGGASVTTTKDSSDTSKCTFIMPASNVTVSAVFVEEGAATYTITIADSIEHGSVSAEPTTAAAGTSVTLTVTLADGYELESITVKDANSADVAVTQDTSDKSKYTFTMPASNVTVSATFTEEAATLSTPLTLKALTAGTIVVKDPKSGMQYSKNGGAKTAMTETTTIEVAIGDTVAFYGSGTNITCYSGTNIAGGTSEVKAYGNIMSLVDEEGFATATALADAAFDGLFQENAKLKDAGELLLPADTLAQDCYAYMFSDCTSLTEASALPATTLAQDCYAYMFSGCTSLTEAPALPATTLADSCYQKMFSGCTSLTEAPALPATTLANFCYYYMFKDCTSLNAVTCLATDVSAGACTTNWLNGVAASGTFTTPKDTSWSSGVNGIPNGWTRLNPDGSEYVNLLTTPLTLKALTAGTIVVDSPKSGMQYSLNGGAKTAVTSEAITVAAGDTVAFYGSGTSITSYNGTWITGGTAEVKAYGNIMSLVDEEGFATATSLAASAFSGLFEGNAKLKDASDLLLPATTLADSCYSDMFSGCTSLTAAPALPATTLAYCCYFYMFSGCTSLTEAPALPATTLDYGCYYYMFKDCTSLTEAPALPATTLADDCYCYMFSGCTSLTEAPALPATTLAYCCYQNMFFGCTSLNAVTCLATDVSANGCTNNWLYGVATSGTFTTPSSTNWSSGVDGIPDGWTRVNSN